MDTRLSFFKNLLLILLVSSPIWTLAQQPKTKPATTKPKTTPATGVVKPSAPPKPTGTTKTDTPIYLVNPSFEDTPKSGEAPTGWYNCGIFPETPPDIQPGSFGVKKAAQQGNTYVGLVVRDNETTESLGQRLSRPLESGNCYTWSLQLSRSPLYLSPGRVVKEDEVNHAAPVKLRIWGGNGYCAKAELLAETAAITNERWLQYDFRLQPKQNITYLMIEAYYKTPILFYYNGNVLMDNAGPIIPIPCNERPKPTPPKVNPKPTPPVAGTTPTPTPKPKPKPVEKPVFDGKQLKEGEIVRVEKIQFDADKADLKTESTPALEEIYKFLTDNPRVIIEIGGHTNNTPPDDFCDNLSNNRAKAVADYVISRGISDVRVKHKGYGKRYPAFPNTTKEGRKKNQRVEVKILSVG
jgi:outer membrane protein OmpA-like peptidoglycan-associated protein